MRCKPHPETPATAAVLSHLSCSKQEMQVLDEAQGIVEAQAIQFRGQQDVGERFAQQAVYEVGLCYAEWAGDFWRSEEKIGKKYGMVLYEIFFFWKVVLSEIWF